MTILSALTEEGSWRAFLADQNGRHRLSKAEASALETFIAEKRYPESVESIRFGYPEKMILSKMGSGKKRVVYSYSPDETWVLKHLANLLYKYDGAMQESCYSFRKSRTVKTAVDRILTIRELDGKYAVKADIHDYFNSIDVPELMDMLGRVIDDDPELLDLMENLLTQDRCVSGGLVTEEKRGAMAGVPLSSFFANVYLTDLDREFEERGTPYFRYSDDILIFTESEEEARDALEYLEKRLAEKKLSLNPSKVSLSRPGEGWEFLGFRYSDGGIGLARATVDKMKGKIRRKARKLIRKRKRKGLPFEKAARSMIRSFDQKFYDLTGNREYTWTGFYFPALTRTDELHEIDEYMVENLRYLATGRHYKGNYRVTYDELKRFGYTPLVAEYYNWKAENARLNRLNRG